MIREILKIRTDNGLGDKNPAFKDIELTEYPAKFLRMGMPELTATLKWPTPLDDEWTGREYITLRGERFYIRHIPSGRKDNNDARYTHEIEFTSEFAEILGDTYFIDAVPSYAETYDKPCTNNTTFSFYGTISEFCDRLNCSFIKKGIADSVLKTKTSLTTSDKPVGDGYCVMLDPYGEGTVYDPNKTYKFEWEDKTLWEAITEGFTVTEIPFERRGKRFIFGAVPQVLACKFEYGHDNELLSVYHKNANAKVINRITMLGSTENIPYYYPNETEYGHIDIAVKNGNKKLAKGNITIKNMTQLLSRLNADNFAVLGKYDGADVGNAEVNQYLYSYAFDGGNFTNYVLGQTEKHTPSGTHATIGTWHTRVFFEVKATGVVEVSGIRGNVWRANQATPIDVTDLITGVTPERLATVEDKSQGIISVDFTSQVAKSEGSISLGWLEKGKYFFQFSVKIQNMGADRGQPTVSFCKLTSIDVTPASKQKTGYYWAVGDKKYDGAGSLGVVLNVPVTDAMIGDGFGWTASDRMPFQDHLVPPKFRDTLGAERFYDALNDTYTDPDTNGPYVFPNPFIKGSPSEHIYRNEEIKPTIEGVTNAEGQLFGVIADIAYDADDNDILKPDATESNDKNDTLKYEHSFFYIKLNIFNGDYGFNLFEHASQTDPMTIQMTDGSCNGCKFKIQAVKFTDETGLETYKNPIVVQGGKPVGVVSEDGIKESDLNPSQQNTQTHSIWICVQKDAETFGVIMPNRENAFRPKVGDPFNIINIDLPQGYILAAEKRLEEEGIRYMADNNEEKFTFDIQASRIFFAENPDVLAQLDEYSKIMVKYNGREYEQYVNQLTIDCKDSETLPNIGIDLTDTLAVGQSFAERVAERASSLISNAYTMGGALGGSGNGGLTTHLADQRYLNKTEADRSVGKIASDVGFEVGEFVSGANGGIFYRDPETGQTYLEVDKIKARMKAIFNELEISKTSSIGGRQIITPGGSIQISYVEELTDSYRCYFKAKEENKGATCLFTVGDQVQCEEFNIQDGISEDASNRYYWRLVTAVNNTESYIELSKSDCDKGSDAPTAGDTVVQLGNRNDKTRQSAIVLSTVDAYAPCVTLYNDIDHYSLDGKAVVEYGVDKTKNPPEPFFNCYGRFFFGPKAGNSYLKFEPSVGKLVFSGELLNISSLNGKDIDKYIEDVVMPTVDKKIEGYDYIKEALADGATTTNGGLLLTSLIKLGQWDKTDKENPILTTVTAGINGLRNHDKTIASWWGGDMVDKYYNDSVVPRPNPLESGYAQALIRMDGSGYLAGGNIRWNELGNLILDNGISLGGGSTTIGNLVDTVESLTLLFNKFSQGLVPIVLDKNGNRKRATWGEIASDLSNLYAVESIKGFYTEEFISARGLNADGSSGGGGATQLRMLDDVLIGSNLASDQALVYNGTKWVNQTIKTGLDESALAGYATESWVLGKGYITSDVLNGYATQDWVLGKKYLDKHQDIYALTFVAGTFTAKTYTPNASAQTVNIPTTTSHITEGSRLYFTDARAQSALAATVTTINAAIVLKLDTSVFNTFKSGYDEWKDVMDAFRKEFNDMFTLEDDTSLPKKKRIRANFGLYTDEFLSARGLNVNGGGGGNGYNRLDSWDAYVQGNGDVLSADLGYGLRTDISNLKNRIDNLPTTSVNPYALTIQKNGTVVATYDGSKAVTANIVIAWGDVTGKPTWIGTSKPTYNFSEIGSLPTTLAGYGITDAKIAGGVITLGSSTITPLVSADMKTLTFASGTFSAKTYTPTSAQTVNIPTTTSHITEGSRLYFTDARAQAALASTVTALNNAIALKLDKTTFEEFKAEFDDMFELETVNGVKRIWAKHGLYTKEYLSARGLNSNAGGGGNFGLMRSWPTTAPSASTNDALGANLGWELRTNLTALTTRVTTLEGRNFLSDLTVSTTGSGNAVTSVTQSADKKTITFTKGTTFLTAHQTLYTLTIQKNGTQVGTFKPNANATINISDVASAATLSSHVGNTTVHITADERTKWNATSSNLDAILGSNTDQIINKWDEIVAFLATYTEADTLANLLSNKADKTTTISAGTGLTGGGSLAANRTLSLATSGVTAGTYFKTTVDVYGRVTAGSNPTTLAGFGITDAYTKTEADNRYVNVTGDTMSGNLTFTAITAAEPYPVESKGLRWSGGSDGANIFYRLTASDAGKLILNLTDDSNTEINFEWSGASFNSGTAKIPYRFLYNRLIADEVAAEFKSLKIGSVTITYDSANKGLKVSGGGLYSETYISARGLNSAGGSGGGLITKVYAYKDLGKTYNDTTLADTFNAYTINEIASRVTSLEGGSALSVTTTGSGNAVTAISKSGTNITVTKGATFLTSHQSLTNYVTLNTTQTISGVKTFSFGLVLPYSGSSWISMATRTSQILGGVQNSASSAHSLFMLKNSSGAAMAFGGLGTNIGFYGFYKSRIDAGTNSYDWNTIWNVDTGAMTHSGTFTASTIKKSGGTSSQFLKADGSVDATSYLPSSTYTASDILTKLKTVDGSGSGLDADLLDGVHASGLFTALTSANESLNLTIGGTSKSVDVQSAGYKWNAVTTVNSWSKLLKIAGYANVLLSVNLSQNSQASNHLYLISCGYNTARIIQLGANGYAGHSAAQIRVTKSAATTFDVEILNDYGYNGATSLSVACKALRLDSQCTLTAYTAYTAGSGTECSSITSSSSAIVSDIKFATARTIWGQSFDGSGNVTGDLTSVGNITGSSAMTIKATGILTLNGTSGIYLKYNNDDAKSLVLNSTQFKPFDSANNKLTLGSTNARWSNTYSVLGNFSGLITASAGIQIGNTVDIGWYANNSRITAGAGTARGVNVGSLLVSNAWADYTKVPTNGIYVKGAVKIGDCEISWDASAKMLKFSTGLYSEGAVSARGANSGGSSGGGLIQTVYGSGDLGKVFSDSTKSDTFNAYTINKLYADKADKTALTTLSNRVTSLEAGSALSVNTTGSGNAITAISKSGTVITATKGSTFLTAITKAMVENVLTGNITSHTHDSLISKGNLAPQIGRTQSLGQLYTYNTVSGATATGAPTTYTSVIGFGRGTSGTVEIAGGWTSGMGLWYRALRDTTDNWFDWRKVVDSVNYTTIVTKIGTATVGSTSKPIYLNAGVPTAISATVGSATKPVYLSAGTVTACSYAFGNGSGNVPVSNGTVNTNLNADMIDGNHLTSLFRILSTNLDLDAQADGNNNNGITYIHKDNSGWSSAIHKFNYGCGLNLSAYAASVQLLFDYGDNEPYYRNRWWSGGNGTWKEWKRLAFLTSNVASATKLQTARTLWGQSFNGTANVSGNMTSVGNITGSGAMTIQSTGGRLTLNAPTTGLDLKFNNTDAKSVILNGTAFKPFDAADNALELGTDSARWKKITTVNMRLSSSTSAGGGDVYLEMWRGTNASWKVLNTGGTLKFQSNYTTAVQSTYFDCFTLAYNTGNAYLKGRLGIGTAAPSYPLDVNGNIRAQSGWLRNTGAYGWYNETYGGGWYMQDSTWIRAYGGKSVYIAAPASLKIGDCTIKYENGALHFDKGIYSDEFVSAKGLNADSGAGGLIEKVYDIDSIGKTFSKTTLTDTFNAHAIQSIATRVSALEGKNYLNDLNVTTTGSGNAITSATLSADKKTLTLTKGTTFATTTQLTNGSVTKIGTSTVGSTSKPIYLNAGVPTALSATVGSATKPVYLSAGVITASSSTVGGTAKPMYLNAGTMTALSATVGASNQPVYLNAGTITAVSGVGIGYLSEGGPNKSGSLGPFDYIDGISANNKFEGLPGQYIKVELWNGSAWVDAGLTDAQKTSLVSYEGLTVSASQTNATSGNKIRVTITAAASVLYFACNKICINFSYNGATNSKVLIERAHVGSETTFETLGTYGVSGWSGWNSIYFGAMNFGGGTTQTSNWRVLRFTFTADAATSDSYKTNKIAVYNILAYGKTAWSYANVLNKWGRPYTYSPSTFLSTFIGGIRPNSNNAHDLGTSAYRWNYIYGAYGNFSTSVTTTQVTSTGALLLDGTASVAMRYNNNGLMMGVQLNAATLQPTANCAGSLSLGSSSARWNATYIKSLNVTDSMTSSKESSTHLAANQGQAIINSTASAGSYTMLARMITTNGYMLIGSYQKTFRLAYTSKETVDKGTNGTDKSVNLLDEDGITTLNILKVGTNGGDFLVNGSSVSIGTTTTISNNILVRRHITVANANMFFTTTTAGTGEGLYFAPVANGSNPYLGLMKHNNRAWAADAVRFYNDGTLWAKTGIWTDGYISAKGQNTSSDAFLKNIIRRIEIDVRKIATAPSVLFTWKDDQTKDVGSIAQFWKTIDPRLTPQGQNGFLTLQYGKAALLSVISVAKKVVSHENEIKALKKEIERLSKRVKELEKA